MDRARLVAVVLACLLPFLGKAVHMDDPMYLWAAEQITRNPLDFYEFDVNWYGYATPMAETNQNPPLVSYWLAAVSGIAGNSELALHGGMAFAAVALALGIHALAARLCARPLLAALCAFLTPAVLVSSTTLMSDVLMLALWCWAAALFVGGLEDRSQARLAIGALLAGLCPLAKYFGAALLPLLFAYGLARERRLGIWSAWLAIPLAGVAGYQAWTFSAYGVQPFFEAIGYALWTREIIGITPGQKIVESVIFLGGGLLTAALFAPLLLRARGLAIGASLALAAAGALSATDRFAELARAGHGAVFGVAGAGLVALAVQDLRARRDPASLLLALWLLGVLAFAAFANWTTSVRAVLPAAPAVGILVARALERTSAGSVGGVWRQAAPLVAGGALSLLVAGADYALAESQRAAAHYLIPRYAAAPGPLWFQGGWGFQWYMESVGATRLDYSASRILEGQIVVLPEYNSNLQDLPASHVEPLETLVIPTAPWGSTLSGPLGAGFYTDVYGPLPFAFGRPNPQRFFIYRARRPIRFDFRPLRR